MEFCYNNKNRPTSRNDIENKIMFSLTASIFKLMKVVDII